MPFSPDRLRETREARRMSRVLLAELAGTSPQYVSHLENGVKANPASSLLESLAAALECEMTDLMAPRPVTNKETTPMRDAADARRLLRAGMFPAPTPARPETTTMAAPTMPPDLYAAVQYLLDVAREKAGEAEALLERHYADAADPGYYRESEYPKGFDGTWNRVLAAKDATQEAAGDFRRYAPKTD